MFRGANTLSLDAKGRMTIPTRYRELLQNACQGRVVLTRDHRSLCLLLYPQPTWDAIERQLSELPNLDESARAAAPPDRFRHRLRYGRARPRPAPSTLREFAGLDKRVMLIGQVTSSSCGTSRHGTSTATRRSPGRRRIPGLEYLSTLSL